MERQREISGDPLITGAGPPDAEQDLILSREESAELARCERIIKTELHNYLASARALTMIRDKRLYRENYPTFETYAQMRWGWSRHHAQRLIRAADVVENVLRPMGNVPLPQNESQARPLTRISHEVAKAVWIEVVAKAKSSKITASLVNQVVTKAQKGTSPPAAFPTSDPPSLRRDIQERLSAAVEAITLNDLELAQQHLALAQIRLDVEINRVKKDHSERTRERQ